MPEYPTKNYQDDDFMKILRTIYKLFIQSTDLQFKKTQYPFILISRYFLPHIILKMSSNTKKGKKGNRKNKGQKNPNEAEAPKIEEVENVETDSNPITSEAHDNDDKHEPEKEKTESTQQEANLSEVSRVDEPFISSQSGLPQKESAKFEGASELKESQAIQNPPKVDQSEVVPTELTQIDNHAKSEPLGPSEVIQNATQEIQKDVDSTQKRQNQNKTESVPQEQEFHRIADEDRDSTVIQVISSGDFAPLAESTQHPSKVSEAINLSRPHQSQRLQQQKERSISKEQNHPKEQERQPLVQKKQKVQNQNQIHQQNSTPNNPQPQAMLLPIIKKKKSQQKAYFFEVRQSAVQPQPASTQNPQEKRDSPEIPNTDHTEQQKQREKQVQIDQNILSRQKDQTEAKSESSEPVKEEKRQIYKSEQISVEEQDRARPIQSEISESAEAVIDLNKPIDENSPKTNTNERLFTLVESNEISANQSNQILIADSFENKKESDEVKIPVKQSLSFSDLNYSAEKSVIDSHEHQKSSAHEEQDRIKVEFIPDVQHKLVASLPVQTVGTCVPNLNATSELFYSIVEDENKVASQVEEVKIVEVQPVPVQQTIEIEKSSERQPEVLKEQVVKGVNSVVRSQLPQQQSSENTSSIVVEQLHPYGQQQSQPEKIERVAQNVIEQEQQVIHVVDPQIQVKEKVAEIVIESLHESKEIKKQAVEHEKRQENIKPDSKVEIKSEALQKDPSLNQYEAAIKPLVKQLPVPEPVVELDAGLQRSQTVLDDASEDLASSRRSLFNNNRPARRDDDETSEIVLVSDVEPLKKNPRDKKGMKTSIKVILSSLVGAAVGGFILYKNDSKKASLAAAGIATGLTFLTTRLF